jgi:hypothetical protein
MFKNSSLGNFPSPTEPRAKSQTASTKKNPASVPDFFRLL